MLTTGATDQPSSQESLFPLEAGDSTMVALQQTRADLPRSVRGGGGVAFQALGVVTLPSRSHPLWADGGGVLLVRNDVQTDVAYIEWYPYVSPVLAPERSGDTLRIPRHRVLEKVGMVKEGRLRRSRVYGGVAFDEAYFSMLRAEWDGLGL